MYTVNGGGPIVSHEYLNALKKFNGELKYDPTNAEHYFDYEYVFAVSSFILVHIEA